MAPQRGQLVPDLIFAEHSQQPLHVIPTLDGRLMYVKATRPALEPEPTASRLRAQAPSHFNDGR
jgi:hypothetical protein